MSFKRKQCIHPLRNSKVTVVPEKKKTAWMVTVFLCFSHSSRPLPVCLCRRPSQWLAPGVTALTRMVSSSSTPIIRKAPEPQRESEPESEKEVDALEMKDKPRPLRYNRRREMLMVMEGEWIFVFLVAEMQWNCVWTPWIPEHKGNYYMASFFFYLSDRRTKPA